jgi:hypothetical protein
MVPPDGLGRPGVGMFRQLFGHDRRGVRFERGKGDVLKTGSIADGSQDVSVDGLRYDAALLICRLIPVAQVVCLVPAKAAPSAEFELAEGVKL